MNTVVTADSFCLIRVGKFLSATNRKISQKHPFFTKVIHKEEDLNAKLERNS